MNLTELHNKVQNDIHALLDKYEEGREVFKVAKGWEYPINIKPEFANEPDLPTTWIELADRVISMIAHGKYDLDTYPNRIDIISSAQMLDVYAGIGGAPPSYPHWSFGKKLISEEKTYKSGRGGLAYEVVFNTNPAIAYCMEDNSKTMQMLVIAHASYGHNSFFKGNHVYKDFTRAGDVMAESDTLIAYIEKCEKKFGQKEVEKILDACHVLRLQGFDRSVRQREKTEEEIKRQRSDNKKLLEKNHDPLVHWTAAEPASEEFNEVAKRPEYIGEENILRFIADYSPVLKEWQREIMRMVADRNQYFYPQMHGMTQVMNEGWATFWHHTLFHDLHAMKLVDDGMLQEFMISHSNVIYIPGEGATAEEFQPQSFNPYKLGFEIYTDIKRICEEPTEEDYEFAPAIAGKGDWLKHLKSAMVNYRDESFIQQYLSPKIMRKLGMFTIELEEKEDEYYRVGAIQNPEGYDKVRDTLAAQLRNAEALPSLIVSNYDEMDSRTLTLRHEPPSPGKALDLDETQRSLVYLQALWGFPVQIVEPYGDDEVVRVIKRDDIDYLKRSNPFVARSLGL